MAPQQPVLLVDFAVYKPPEELKVHYLEAQKASRKWKVRIDGVPGLVGRELSEVPLARW